MVSLWALQRLAMRVRGWFEVVTSQMAGGALARVAPGGGAIGAALQYRLLVQAGVARTNAVGGLTAANLLTFAVVLALPVSPFLHSFAEASVAASSRAPSSP